MSHAARPPARPRTFWPTLALAVLLVAGGAVVAIRAWLATGGPDGAVRGYFAALADADAATALGYGNIPDGPRTLLRSSVLREQQRLAPITDVDTHPVSEAGGRARVRVDYTLGFDDRPQRVTATVRLHDTDDGWRLDAVAVATQVLVRQAAERATLAGTRVPVGTTLLFPGAVPVDFDTPYLQQAADADTVSFAGGASTQVSAAVSPAGRDAARAAVGRALTACLRSGSDPRCPLPTERYVPGSVRGTVTGSLSGLTVEVTDDDSGVLQVRGDVSVRGGYRRLEFDDAVTVKRATTFRLPVAARAFAVAPLTVTWTRPG